MGFSSINHCTSTVLGNPHFRNPPCQSTRDSNSLLGVKRLDDAWSCQILSNCARFHEHLPAIWVLGIITQAVPSLNTLMLQWWARIQVSKLIVTPRNCTIFVCLKTRYSHHIWQDFDTGRRDSDTCYHHAIRGMTPPFYLARPGPGPFPSE